MKRLILTALAAAVLACTVSAQESAQQDRNAGKKILVAYFSYPENLETARVDAVSSASVIPSSDKATTQYMAELIQEKTGADIFRIRTTKKYPEVHRELTAEARNELRTGARPPLAQEIDNIESYDVIFLGYPDWWADIPMVMYTFLEKYDLSGKTIIPFCTHGGSGFGRSVATIRTLQKNADVSRNGLTLSRNDYRNYQREVNRWLEGLGY